MRVLPLLLLFILLARPATAGTPDSAPVRVLHLEGIISPVTAGYVERELAMAARDGAALVVIRLDTPGGLDRSMRSLTQALLDARLPVAVYVAPPGARAASAGMFVAIAAHIAAMAPGTNIGAAHPVAVGGGEMDEVQSAKATSDAAALARSVAVERGRNADWVEKAVRQSVSLPAEEAVRQDVVDLVAPTLEALLQAIDGRRVEVAGRQVVIGTAGAPLEERPMGFLERLLMAMVDPNVAYLLFTLGTIGLIAELYNPGSLIPGTIGAISLILAFTAFGNLPVNWGGVALLVIGMGLLVVEMVAPGLGFAGLGGVVAFLLGSLLLFAPLGPPSPSLPTLRVSPWLIGVTTAGVASFVVMALGAVARSLRAPVRTGVEALVGTSGVALTLLSPGGSVRVAGEVWTASAEQPPIKRGEAVRVTAVEGVTLQVARDLERS